MLINSVYKWLFIHPEVELAISERSSQWFIDFLFITCDSRKCNKLCGRKTTKQNGFTLWIRFLLLSFCLVSCVVELVIAEIASTSQPIRTSFFTMLALVWSSGRFLTAKTHILKLNSDSQDWRPLPDMSSRLVPSPLHHISPVFQSWAFVLVSCVVELVIAEMACVSRNIRTVW